MAGKLDIIIVTGLLGVGKTSFILSATGRLNALTGKKIAIMVNDFGDVGVDGSIMSRYGLNYMELPGGCICCTLRSSLTSTLDEIIQRFEPDTVIIEPSGIADPRKIIEVLSSYQGSQRLRVIAILDAIRFDEYARKLERPLTKQLDLADIVLINKVDTARPEQIRAIQRFLRERGFSREIFTISSTEGTNLDDVIRSMMTESNFELHDQDSENSKDVEDEP